jgi:hypothetical protein
MPKNQLMHHPVPCKLHPDDSKTQGQRAQYTPLNHGRCHSSSAPAQVRAPTVVCRVDRLPLGLVLPRGRVWLPACQALDHHVPTRTELGVQANDAHVPCMIHESDTARADPNAPRDVMKLVGWNCRGMGKNLNSSSKMEYLARFINSTCA